LFLICIAILSLSLYVTDLGFYDDDWALLSSMHLSSDQSLAGVFTAVDSSQDNEIRPIQFLGYAVPYKLFGLNPLGYHLINAIFFAAAFTFLYLILTEFRQPRALCLAIPIIYVSTKYRCHSFCHLEMSLLGGWGRTAGGRGAPGVAQRPTGAQRTMIEIAPVSFYRAGI
jgi:hypothetical protein